MQFILSQRYKIGPEKGNTLGRREPKMCMNYVQKVQFDINLFVHVGLFLKGGSVSNKVEAFPDSEETGSQS